MTDLPSGTVTFLFSDIEGSTRLVKELRDQYAQVLAEHRRLVRAAIASQAGHEIDTQGDAFFVAFANAKRAVLCALEVQRALAGHAWPSGTQVRVRMGIHTGQATPVEGAYTGLAVHRAARICAAARGGQVLLSQATQTLIEDEEEDELGFALVELGERRLKDLDRPVRLFELATAGLAAAGFGTRDPSPRADPEPGSPGTGPAPALPPIVGRAAELRIVSAACARMLAGQSQLMLITGEAGIGKTRLVEELIGQIRSAADATRVYVGESAPMAGAALAYGPFVAALGNEAGWLLADDRAGDMIAARHRLFVRVLELLVSLAARSPLVVVLEDLHWADESSRELLAFLVVRLREHPVMMVGTVREEELSDPVRRWLTELEHRPTVTRLRLGRMADTEIAGLVAGAMPAGVGPDQVAAVVAAADGNPLYARELANSDPSGGPPASITDAVLARAAGLAASARAVVDQVCVADGGMSHQLLAATVELPEKRLLAAARAGVDSGLLVPNGDGYSFTHALIRQVIYAQILPGERRRLHRRLAEVLAGWPGSDPGPLARHWHLAGCPDRAAAAAVLAARHAVSVRAYPEAKKNYVLAFELADWLPEAGPDLLEEAARAASWAGDPEQAAAWAAEAVAQSDAAPVDRARRLERLGRYRWQLGDPKAAVEATEQAMVILENEPPSQLQARVLAALATRRMLLGETDKALPLADRAVAVARHTGADAVHAHGLATLGIIRAQHGDLEAGLADLQSAFMLACRAGSAEDTIRAAANRVYLLYRAGRFAEAVEAGRAGRSAAVAMGAPPTMTSGIGNNAAAALVASGRWAEADRLLVELITEAPTNFTRYLHLLQLEMAVGRGETQRAADLAATLRKSPEDPRLTGTLHACLAEQALDADNLAVAAAEVVDGLAALSGAELAEDEIRLLAAGARLAADLALRPDAARLRDIPDGWEQLAATFAGKARLIVAEHAAGQPDLVAFGAVVAAEEARRRGRDTRATWRVAAEAWRTAGWPYREAYARLREAAAAIRAERREPALRALAVCQQLAGELGAARLLTLADGLAHRAGLAPGAADSGRSAQPGTGSDLTD